MRYKGDWLIDPDGRMTEDRKDGPVTTYKLSPEELKKYQGGKVMTEVNIELDGNKIAKAIMPEVENEKKRMTKTAVIECHGKGMTDDEIAEHFGYTGKAKKLALARIAKALKPEEPKVEPVEMTQVIEPKHDFWDGVKHELWGMREAEIDKVNESFEKILARWVGGDHSEETTAALMFYGEKVLNV